MILQFIDWLMALKKNLSKINLTKEFIEAANDDFIDEKTKKYLHDFWFNTRDSGGLRLTDYGFKFVTIKADIKDYKIEFPNDFKITPQILLYLDKYIDSPYYINKHYIFVFSERTAFELYLFSGDIRKYGYTKALSDRLNQN